MGSRILLIDSRFHATTTTRLAYLIVLVVATLTPFQFDFELAGIARRFAGAFQPGVTVRDGIDAVRNVALFAGWGVLWAATASRGQLAPIVRWATSTGFALSVSIETLQLAIPERTSTVLDVFTNTLGSLTGAACFVVMVAAISTLKKQKSYVGVPALVFATSYLIALFTEAVFPSLRLEVLPNVFGGPITRLRQTIGQFEWGSILALPILEGVLFLPVGAFAVAALVELGWTYRRAVQHTVIAGALLFVIAEIGHAALAYPIQLGAIVVHVTAVALGAEAAVRWIPSLSRQLRGRRRPAALAIAYTALLSMWAWRPYLPRTSLSDVVNQLSLSRLVPLQAQAWRVELFSVADIVGPFFLFLPLGSLLAAWPVRRTGWLAHYLPAAYLAVALEVGQVFVDQRFFDGTDLIVQCAGAAIGWAATRRAGLAPHGQMMPR